MDIEAEKARAERRARRRRKPIRVSKQKSRTAARVARLLYGDEPSPAARESCAYLPGYADAIVEYFRDRYEQMEDPRKYATEHRLQYVMKPVRPPTVDGWAAEIGVSVSAIEKWVQRFPKFGEAYAVCMAMQNAMICEGAACGAYNPNFSALWMKNVHKWQDKVEATHRGSVTLNFDAQDEDA